MNCNVRAIVRAIFLLQFFLICHIFHFTIIFLKVHYLRHALLAIVTVSWSKPSPCRGKGFGFGEIARWNYRVGRAWATAMAVFRLGRPYIGLRQKAVFSLVCWPWFGRVGRTSISYKKTRLRHIYRPWFGWGWPYIGWATIGRVGPCALAVVRLGWLCFGRGWPCCGAKTLCVGARVPHRQKAIH